MKKYILLYQYHDDFVYSFDTLKELENYAKLWQIEEYTIALVYKEVTSA